MTANDGPPAVGSITVDGIAIHVATPRLTARFEGPKLIALNDARGKPLVARDPAASPAGLELLFAGGDLQPLGVSRYARISAVAVSATVAHVHVSDTEGDATLRISVDAEGRLVVEPSAYTARQGLAGVRWNVAGIQPGLDLVAPLWQGCRMPLEHPLLATAAAFDQPFSWSAAYEWPFMWEAALAILQASHGGWSVSAHDARHAPKRLSVGHPDDPRTLGFEAQVHGPLHDSTAAGSLAWLIDTHAGGWEAAAGVYRDWLRDSHDHDHLLALRPDWAGDIRFTLQWCPCDAQILDAVARLMDPRHVLIHVPNWRADRYDENYPEYVPGSQGQAFIAYAVERGFRVLPHFNYFAIDPNHPAFSRLMPYVMRALDTQRLMGWRWVEGEWVAFPQGHTLLRGLRDEKTMAYIHTGASAWRRLLVERIAAAAADLAVPGVFVDQTLCTWNLDNALVETLSSAEGMVALTRELCDLDGVPAVGGEGLNELSAQYQTFAQAHLFKSHHTNTERFEELNPVPLGRFLYGDLCRTMGYAGLGGDTPESALRLEVHEKLGALPSLTIRSAGQLEHPTPAVRRVLDRAIG